MIYGLSIAALSPFEYNLKFVYWIECCYKFYLRNIPSHNIKHLEIF